MWNKWAIFFVAILLISSCGTKRKSASISKDTHGTTVTVGNMEINNLDFHSFSGRAKAKIEFANQQHDVTLNFRINRDQTIWISVTALLGIEVARILITPDSVKILNKLQAEYIHKPFNYIHRYTNPGITFATLQDLFMGNVSLTLLRTDQLTVADSGDEMQLVGVKDQLSFQYSLNTNRRPKVFRLVPMATDQSMESYYGKYADFGGYDFPQNQHIQLRGENMKINAQLEYNKVVFNEILEFPFSVPARYKVVE